MTAYLKRLRDLRVRVRGADSAAAVELVAECGWRDFNHLLAFVTDGVTLRPAAFDVIADAWAGFHDTESLDQAVARMIPTPGGTDARSSIQL